MSHTVTKLHFNAPSIGSQPGLMRAVAWLRAVRQDAATRRLLGTLDDRALSDIGVSRAQAQFEAESPVWDFHR